MAAEHRQGCDSEPCDTANTSTIEAPIEKISSGAKDGPPLAWLAK